MKRRGWAIILTGALLAACQPSGPSPAPLFALAPQAGSLTVRFAPPAGYHANYLEPRNWDTAEGTLVNADPAIASSTVTVAAADTSGGLSATLRFPNVTPADGYTLTVRLLNTHSGQPTTIASVTRADVALGAGANTLTLDAPQATPSIAPPAAFGPYVVSVPSFGAPGRLGNAQSCVVDARGRYLVLDNGQVRLIRPDAAGQLSIVSIAGQNATTNPNAPGSSRAGFVDGPGASALFNSPRRMVLGPDGALYIADTGNNAIRKVVLDDEDRATVSTVAGNGQAGLVNGPGTSAEFNAPQGLAIDAQGNLYVADTGNNVIRQVDPAGNVTTLAGNGVANFQDGAAASAEFNGPLAVAVDATGRVWVADTDNYRLRTITRSANGASVATVSGTGSPGTIDGLGSNVRLGRIVDLAFEPDGALDFLDQRLRQLTYNPAGIPMVTTLAGGGNVYHADGPGLSAVLYDDVGVSIDASGAPLLLSPHTLVRAAVDKNNQVQLTRVFGDYLQTDTTPIDGPGRYDYDFQPQDFAVDAAGDVFVTTLGNQIYEIPAGTGDPPPILIAGDGQDALKDGAGPTAEFAQPGGITFGPDGALYVADLADGTIRRVAKPGNGPYTVSTYAGGFSSPYLVTCGPDGALYVADTGNNRICRVTASSPGQPVVTTVAGSGQAGLVDGPATIARFSGPTGLAFDAQGDLLVADHGNFCVRRISFDAQGNATTVSTLAGSGQPGYQDGVGTSASFMDPHELVATKQGTIDVIDAYRVRALSLDAAGAAVVSTLAGADKGFSDGAAATARFGALAGAAIDPQGDLLLADFDNRVIRKLMP